MSTAPAQPSSQLSQVFQFRYRYSDPFVALRARNLFRMTQTIFVLALVYFFYEPFSELVGAGLPAALGLTLIFIVAQAGILVLINRGSLIVASLVFVMALFCVIEMRYI